MAPVVQDDIPSALLKKNNLVNVPSTGDKVGEHEIIPRALDSTWRSPPARPRARHAKFGEGTEVSEKGDKLEIEFASGRKLLDRRFVKLLE